ncbi:MAG TPA: hypothetical protein VFP67_09660 [Acidimicrobiia bacterium]|nr:hypothetical protein [Acidimicrobiia bacterium]
MAYSELRVHGMSGTPPRDLLYSDPVSYDRSDPFARIYESNRDGKEVKAFHWGSLTSGSRITAFWLLLMPFMLANLAGWMASTKSRVQAFIRLTGLFITCLLVAQLALVTISMVNEIFDEQTYHAAAVAGGAAVLALVFLSVLWRLSAQSLLEPMTTRDKFRLLFGLGRHGLEPPGPDDAARRLQVRDPAPGATLDHPSLWIRQPILDRLRRQHLAAGILVIVVVLELRPGESWLLLAALFLGALIVLDTVLIAVPHAFAEAVRTLSGANVLIAFGLLAFAISRLFGSDLPLGIWPHIHELILYIAILAGAASAVTLVTQLVLRPGKWQQSFLPLSALALSASFGGALGVAAALLAELASYRFLGALNPYQTGATTFDIAKTGVMVNGGAWTVESMLAFFLALIGFAALAGWSGDLPPRKQGREWALLRCVTMRSAFVFGGTGIIAAVLALPAVYIACASTLGDGCNPQLLRPNAIDDVLPRIAGVIALFTIVTLSYAVFRVSKPLSFLVPTVGLLIVWLVYDKDFNNAVVWNVPIIDLPVRPFQFLDLSVVLIVFGITFFIVRSIVGGFGDPEKRRKVGMLWDTGSFWPRWFHPLAPPSYSPHAVKMLNRALDGEQTEILTAHSQGSVISCVALSQPDAPLPRAFVTYGSPLGILYDQLFPFAGVRSLISKVEGRWGHNTHWVNLWRKTDPLGGAPVPCITRNKLIESGVGHSNYELSDEFIECREDAIAGHVRTRIPGCPP